MLHVHGRRNSNQVIQVMWTVGELGLEHVRHDAGGSFGGLDTPAYAALNPNRLIPTIEEDGFALWESYAIVRYLARRHGRGSLWPEDDRDLEAEQSLIESGLLISGDLPAGAAWSRGPAIAVFR